MPEQRPRPAWQLALRAGLRLSLLALPFVAAGSANWIRGWIFIGLIGATMAVNIAVIRRKNPGLLRARLESPAGTKRFDKIYAAVSGAAALAFLERTVRIQSERGHVAVTSGPYRFVRHPMYADFMLAVPGWTGTGPAKP